MGKGKGREGPHPGASEWTETATEFGRIGRSYCEVPGFVEGDQRSVGHCRSRAHLAAPGIAPKSRAQSVAATQLGRDDEETASDGGSECAGICPVQDSADFLAGFFGSLDRALTSVQAIQMQAHEKQ